MVFGSIKGEGKIRGGLTVGSAVCGARNRRVVSLSASLNCDPYLPHPQYPVLSKTGVRFYP